MSLKGFVYKKTGKWELILAPIINTKVAGSETSKSSAFRAVQLASNSNNNNNKKFQLIVEFQHEYSLSKEVAFSIDFGFPILGRQENLVIFISLLYLTFDPRRVAETFTALSKAEADCAALSSLTGTTAQAHRELGGDFQKAWPSIILI
ncbi:hypothetical protein LWI29_000240 [Acer saccharum]|uniref:Uncharacterized protein n=1 Tax=Acer saccharum TaxID=4024 RepID=A0AA39TGU2_ACESA|nr:hypothetical protein LWI29_000240 [Acer saccharum]